MEPGFEGQPPPERRGVWFWLSAVIGALLGAGLFGVTGHLFRTGRVDLAAGPTGTLEEFGLLIVGVSTVVAFVLLIFRPTRGLGSGFLVGGAVALVVHVALAVYAGLSGG
jgi:hypothetical protein